LLVFAGADDRHPVVALADPLVEHRDRSTRVTVAGVERLRPTGVYLFSREGVAGNAQPVYGCFSRDGNKRGVVTRVCRDFVERVTCFVCHAPIDAGEPTLVLRSAFVPCNASDEVQDHALLKDGAEQGEAHLGCVPDPAAVLDEIDGLTLPYPTPLAGFAFPDDEGVA
jgi:hypothetical protein